LKLSDHKDRTVYAAGLTLVILTCLFLVGQLRGFFFDIWAIASAVIGPLVISVIFTYVLRPVVDAFEARHVPRSLAILLLYVLLGAILWVLLINTLPLLIEQMTSFIRQLPTYVGMLDTFLDHMTFAARVLPKGVRAGVERALGGAEGSLATWFSGALIGVKDLIGGTISAFVIPFLVFYLLKDYSLFTNLVIRLFPKASRQTVGGILVGIDQSLGRYVRGQLLVMVLVGAATFVGLWIVRMPNALLLGSIVGLTNLIPYVGPFIGAAPGLFMALGVSTSMLLKVLVVNLVVQQLEGNILSPWIMGKTMNLHPLLILLAVMLAGEIAGVTGLIFAVPALAAVKVVVEQVRAARE